MFDVACMFNLCEIATIRVNFPDLATFSCCQEMPSYLSAALTWGTETQAEVVGASLATMATDVLGHLWPPNGMAHP